MKKILILLFAVCLLTTGCFGTKEVDKEEEKENITAEKISYKELKDIVDNFTDYLDTDVVDIRDEESFEEGHIKGAMNIPYEDLGQIIISKEREIIIYGDTPYKSRQAANDLISDGYTKVKYIAGINKWPYDLED